MTIPEHIQKKAEEFADMRGSADEGWTYNEMVSAYIQGWMDCEREEWIDNDVKPLVKETPTGWITTENCPDQFIAALQYCDNETGKQYWWIHHCIIEENIGLCVVGEDDNQPAGWNITDIEYYYPIPKPPKQ